MSDQEVIKAVYFQECAENLAVLEQGLSELEAGKTDAQTIDVVLRTVHSVKGGAAAFAFDAIVEWAHTIETTLDHVRSGKREATVGVFQTLLSASEILDDYIAAAKGEGSVDKSRAAEVRAQLEAFVNRSGAANAEARIEPEQPGRREQAGAAYSFGEGQPSDLHDIAESRPAIAVPPTIRVGLERVDRMIGLVDALVASQANLTERIFGSEAAKSSQLAMGLEKLEQLTREMRDSLMAIRAQPMRSVFQRMPRLVRETAASTSKEVRLDMEGETLEVDSILIERLADPITHMLRNAIDHGLEPPDVREAIGKPREGQVRLSAFHRSGRIVIEVVDDGAGINRTRVRDIAVEKGIVAVNANLTDEEINKLIFQPGFSTAESLSKVSGRGLGMDVVNNTIQSLGGRISVESSPGNGTVFSMSFPLTLGTLDRTKPGDGSQSEVA